MASFLLILITSFAMFFHNSQISAPDQFFIAKPDKAGEAKIVLEKQGNKLIIQGVFVPSGAATGKYNYKLATFKAGKAGNSANKQAGNFEVKKDQAQIILATSGMNIGAADRLDVELLVYEKEKLIAKDVVHYQAP